ncbi:sodium:solute symporter family transporter [Candidatus Cardinium sp. TP]|uniref:sodium:solute symporter family transporter n=1 Tax=Candidatus Cardinium sp. TP TaxID=2961955 RepID=UPI0021B04AFF|nr:HD domain-containing protein [Candidatus Cardinium sp. TP]MCT4696937.1 HD domain-containing protein [Candidatus Cardinium sp. TP]MDN5246880.1 HD domain-containing protein [Candidatus Cardinium sp.]
MSCLNTPLFIVVAFLVLTLVIGIYFSRKETSLREYAVGNKQFATATLVATVLATLYGGGGLVRTVECVYTLGLYWIIIGVFVNSFSIWLFSRLMLRMGPFMQNLSIAETISNVYGKYPRIITALVGICTSIVSITMQIIVMVQSVSMCVDLDLFNARMVTIFAASILIFYSIFGGVRAVTFTDVLQFITFTIIIPFLAWFMFKKTGKSIVEVVALLQSQEKFQFSSLCHFDTKLLSMIAMCLCIMVPDVGTPQIMQRVYMSSGPIQAKKVFSYVSVLGFFITSLIFLIGLFVFVGASELPTGGIWHYILTNVSPIFKGMVCVSLLAMAMSTADSCLNACSVIVSHDILQSLQKENKVSDVHQLKIARWTSLVVGLSSMFLTFYCKDLLELLMLCFAFSLPVITAPSLLAMFGFRGTSRTALIGMGTGALTILAWNKWVKSKTGIDGTFVCMLANGLAMMAAHYLFKQPEGAGWVGPDHLFKQMQQVHARKQAARKEAIKNSLLHIKDTLVQLRPSHATLTAFGFYVVISNLLIYFVASIVDHDGWLMFQLLIGACFLGYSTFISEKIQSIPGWFMGLFWFMGLAFCLPMNVLWHWWYGTNLFLTLGVSLAHLVVTLLLLPVYLGVSFLIATLLIAICLSSVYCTKALVLSPSSVALLLLLFLGMGLLIFGIFLYLKLKNNSYFDQVRYLKDREQLRASRKLKASLYDSAMVSFPGFSTPKGRHSILAQVVGKIEESISFLDSNMPLYKQDFQSIINKLYDWVAYFNKKEKAKEHALLQPTKLSVDQLIRKVELALSQEVTLSPQLFVEQIKEPNGAPCAHIVCDINQVVYLLVQAILRVSGKLEGSYLPIIVRIQLHNTGLQFKQADPIDNSYPSFMDFPATALVVSQASVAAEALPEVKVCYDELIDVMATQRTHLGLPAIDLQQATMASIVDAHYGYLSYPTDGQPSAILLVLPRDVTAIRDKMTAKLPIDCLTSESPVTPKEQADSMMALMHFHDYVCKASYQEDAIDIKTISGLLLLLRQHFGFKRHTSGQLFYVRSVGIAEYVVEWAFHSPKVIYAALLYELVRHTCLPLSYIKQHYNLGVYAFVLNVVGIDQRQALDDPSLLYVQNRLKEAIKEDHVQLSVLFIKLAERLYDLRHASGYVHLAEVEHMAQETLAIDVQIANSYLGPEIGLALAQAAKQALEMYTRKNKTQHKQKDQDR